MASWQLSGGGDLGGARVTCDPPVEAWERANAEAEAERICAALLWDRSAGADVAESRTAIELRYGRMTERQWATVLARLETV